MGSEKVELYIYDLSQGIATSISTLLLGKFENSIICEVMSDIFLQNR